MEKLEHELWIVQAVNAALGPGAAALLRALGRPVPAHGEIIPDYLVMAGLIVVAWTVLRPVFATFEVACFYWALASMPLADVMTYLRARERAGVIRLVKR